MQITIIFLDIKCEIFEVKWPHSRTNKSGWIDFILSFFRNLCNTQNQFQGNTLIICMKIYLKFFCNYYHFYHVFTIISKQFFYNWNFALNYCGLPVKSTSGVTFLGKFPLLFVWHIAFLFSKWLQKLTPLLILVNFNVLIVLVPWYFFRSLNRVIKLSLSWVTVSHMEISKQCII